MYENDVGGGMAIGDCRIIQLLQSVVAVLVDETLILNIGAHDADHDGNTSSCMLKFTPMIQGEDDITCVFLQYLSESYLVNLVLPRGQWGK